MDFLNIFSNMYANYSGGIRSAALNAGVNLSKTEWFFGRLEMLLQRRQF